MLICKVKHQEAVWFSTPHVKAPTCFHHRVDLNKSISEYYENFREYFYSSNTDYDGLGI